MSLIEEQYIGYYLDQKRRYRKVNVKVFLLGIIDDGLDKISEAETLRENNLKKQKQIPKTPILTPTPIPAPTLTI